MALNDITLAFIGGGHITSIIADNLTRAGIISPKRMIVSDPDDLRLTEICLEYSLIKAENNPEAVKKGDLIFINVLPQIVHEVVGELSENPMPPGKLLITLAAGIPIKTYDVLGDRLPVVRALPNPASRIGQGVVALAFNRHVTAAQKEDVSALFSGMGLCIELEEEQIDAVTSLSSPAAVYLFFQSMIDAGVHCGIDRRLCTKIVYQAITGAMAVWKQSGVRPHELIDEASTPGGVSVETLFTLDRYAFRAAIKESIGSGARRAAEMGRNK